MLFAAEDFAILIGIAEVTESAALLGVVQIAVTQVSECF